MTTASELLSKLKMHSAKGEFVAAWGVLRTIMTGPIMIPDLQKLNAALTEYSREWRFLTENRVKKIALIGGYTTQPICELLLPTFLAEGCWAEVYEGSYKSFDTEPFDQSSPLFSFRPDIVLVATGSRNISKFPLSGSDSKTVSRDVEEELARFKIRWEAIAENTNATIIQHNFEQCGPRTLGRLEGRYTWSRTNYIQKLNEKLWLHDGHEIRVLDVAQLSAELGGRNWCQTKWYHHSKHGFDPRMISYYGYALAGVVRGLLGTTRKCLVLDLDNTLWGGVDGDDGWEGVALGSISAEGEAFGAFAEYLKELQKVGVVLAVNSKNDEEIAKSVFLNHMESPLRLGDFAAFVCNWGRKSENLKTIANLLNINLDSIVFADDNPSECEEVRSALPEVLVIELNGDPSLFPAKIEQLHLFAPFDLTEEDFLRTKSYHAMQAVNMASTSQDTLSTYLESLKMEAIIHRSSKGECPRIAQLFSKSNQFNLTGKRFSVEELNRLIESKEVVILSAYLKDTVTNYGLVSSVVAHICRDTLSIDNWIMSCRVFSRTFEHAVFNFLIATSEQLSCKLIEIPLIPNGKNKYAQEFVARSFDSKQGMSKIFQYKTTNSSKRLETFASINSDL